MVHVRLLRGMLLSALGLAACSSSSQPEQAVSTAKQALTNAPATYTLSVKLPVGTSITSTVVGSASTLGIGSSTRVTGIVAAGPGLSELQPDSNVVGSITALGNVTLDDRATVTGNVTATGAIVVPSDATITGTKNPSAALSANTISWTVTNPGGSQGPVALASSQIGSPAPGTYDAVTVSAGATLFLRSGTYFFSSVDVESNAQLIIDSRKGPVFVYINDSLIYRGRESGVDSGIPQLFVAYLGTAQATLESPFSGVFLAPNAALQLQNAHESQTNFAQFYGASFKADSSEVIQPIHFDWSTVPGFPVPPGGWATVGSGLPPFPVVTIPAPAVQLHAGLQGDGTGAGSDSSNPSAPVPFTLPQSFDIGGEIANGTAKVTYTAPDGSTQSCTFQGQGTSANPTTTLDLEAGRLLKLLSCTDGAPLTAQRTGTNFNLAVSAPPAFPVSVDLPLDDRSCSASFEIMTGLQTRQLHDSFDWSIAKTVDEKNPDGTPTLYYAWVYVHTDADVLILQKLFAHILTRPLFTQELEQYAGKCGTFRNPGDGVGTMIPVLLPGTSYNALVNVLTAQNVSGNRKIFDAVILRNTDVPTSARNANGSVNLTVLAQSGFQYLGYLPQPLPDQDAITLNGGAVTAVLDAATFVLQAARTVGHVITTAFGSIDRLISGSVTFNVNLRSLNHEGDFDKLVPMQRAWGPNAGKPLAASGLTVSLLENTVHGLIPETFSTDTDSSGLAVIQPAKHGSSDVAGSGICIALQNDAARITDFLLSNELCDFSGFDANATRGRAVGISPFQISDFDSDRNLELDVSDIGLAEEYESTDAYDYVGAVIGQSLTTAHVLMGTWANVVGVANHDSAFTMCFHLRNTDGSSLANVLTGGFVQMLHWPNTVDALSALGGFLANNDILIPDSGISQHREVGTHEYGHYILCNYLHEKDSSAIDKLIINTFNSNGSSLAYPTRYVNEAFADFISTQVTSIANYGWVSSNGTMPTRVCSESANSPCVDQNFHTQSTGDKDSANIGRLSSMISDAFDGHTDPNHKFSNVPNDADAWTFNVDTYQFTSDSWGSFDSAQEQAALNGDKIRAFADALAVFPPLNPGAGYLDDFSVMGALQSAMHSGGLNWCQICPVLELHSPATTDPNNATTRDLLLRCNGQDAFVNTVTGPSPVDPTNLRIDARTCMQCPAGQISDDNGVCQPCSGTIIGDTCVQCNADVVIDGTTSPLDLQQFATTTVGPNQNCPGWFWLEVDHPDAFFSRGAQSIGSVIDFSTLSKSECEQSYQLTVGQQSGANFSLGTPITATGTYDAATCIPTDPTCLNLSSCDGLPSKTFGTAASLPSNGGSVAPIRFGVPSQGGVLLDFNAPTTQPPPR